MTVIGCLIDRKSVVEALMRWRWLRHNLVEIHGEAVVAVPVQFPGRVKNVFGHSLGWNCEVRTTMRVNLKSVSR